MDHITNTATPNVKNTRFLDLKTKEIRDAIRNKFFDEGKINTTPRGYLDPLLYDIDSNSKSHKSVFYDISGEDFSREPDNLQQIIVQKCAWSSRNIILIIDPTTLRGVQDEPNIIKFRSVPTNRAEGAFADSLNSYLTLVISKNPEGKRFLRNVNLAVVITKMDLFDGDPDLSRIIQNESTHLTGNKFNIREVEDVSREMKAWIRLKKGDLLLGALEEYPNARIFGVSSGSEDPSAKISPKRLLDPYMWLLYRNGIIN